MRSKLHLACIACFISFATIFPESFSSEKWKTNYYYISNQTAFIYSYPSVDSTITDTLIYLDKCLAIIDKNAIGLFGWKEIIYPVNGFIQDNNLFNQEEKEDHLESINRDDFEKENSRWKSFDKYCRQDHSLIKEKPDFQSITIGTIEKDDRIAIVEKENFNNKIWSKVVYPFKGYVLTEDLLDNLGNYYLEIGGLYGVKEIPYEKNFSNFKNPYGGFLEFSKTNWQLGFRAGYTYNESNISTYVLEAHIIPADSLHILKDF